MSIDTMKQRLEMLGHTETDHKCSVCKCDFIEDEGGIKGYFGMLSVAFCPSCFSSLSDMFHQIYSREWVELRWSDTPDNWVGNVDFMEGAKWAERTLRERNE